ncbi:MAG: hypothetical protein S4CHLAM7_12470 [Chlamydiae bacterium]|nr:hypothetical protein [Chlamydiota bacterium]
MNIKHNFLFNSEEWIGDGSITFNEFGHGLKFYTQWKVFSSDKDSISCAQEIEVEGLMDKTQNKFTLSDIKAGTFSITLENESLGKVVGKGVMDDKTVAWEFSNKELGFEGFEVYELQEDGNYVTRGEYVSIDQLRTIIEGKIWKKQVQSNEKTDESNQAEDAEEKDSKEATDVDEEPLF